MRCDNFHREEHVLDCRAPWQQHGILKRHAANLERALHRLTRHAHRSALWRMQAGDELEKRGFSATARAHNRDELALFDLQAGFRKCDDPIGTSVRHTDVLQIDNRLLCRGHSGTDLTTLLLCSSVLATSWPHKTRGEAVCGPLPAAGTWRPRPTRAAGCGDTSSPSPLDRCCFASASDQHYSIRACARRH